MAAVLEPGVIVTSYDVISLCYGPQTFLDVLSTFQVSLNSFNILGVKRWRPNEPPSPPLRPRRPKKKARPE